MDPVVRDSNVNIGSHCNILQVDAQSKESS